MCIVRCFMNIYSSVTGENLLLVSTLPKMCFKTFDIVCIVSSGENSIQSVPAIRIDSCTVENLLWYQLLTNRVILDIHNCGMYYYSRRARKMFKGCSRSRCVYSRFIRFHDFCSVIFIIEIMIYHFQLFFGTKNQSKQRL